MKVLLINPASKVTEGSRKLKAFLSPIPPLGLAYIAAVLEKDGVDVKIIDQVAGRIPNKLLLNKIKEFSADLVGFSCLTSVMSNVAELGLEIRKFSRAKIVLGNIHPTIFAGQILTQGAADFIVRGEGDATMAELAKAVKDNSGFTHIQGISYRQGKDIFHNEERPLIGDLDTLPYPAWHLLELKDYRDSPMILIDREPVVPIAGSRGCAYKCSFCAQDAVYPLPRYRKTEAVIAELEHFHSKFNIRNFGFVDANFPFSISSGTEFCNALIRSGLHKKIRWATETRVDLVNEELLALMKKAGVHLIMFGFESGNRLVMDSVNKRIPPDQSLKIAGITRKLKVHTLGLFILGLPGETKQSCTATIKFAKDLDCDIAKFNIAVPYPGSKFFREFYKGKVLDTDRFTPWHDWSDSKEGPVYVPPGLNARELVGLQRKAMFEFYARPKKFISLLILQRKSIFKILYGAYILTSKYFAYLFFKYTSRLFAIQH